MLYSPFGIKFSGWGPEAPSSEFFMENKPKLVDVETAPTHVRAVRKDVSTMQCVNGHCTVLGEDKTPVGCGCEI